MSETNQDVPKQAPNSIPSWIASGILGLAVGAGAMYLGVQFFGPNDTKPTVAKSATPGGRPAPGAPGGGPMMGGAGMGGGGMGMGGMGGGGSGGKRNLTSLVGKLELLSRADVKLHVELNEEQAKKVAAKLEELAKAEKMTAEDAQSHLETLEGLLTSEQKKTLDLIGLPFGRPGAGGGRGAAGRPGAGGGTQPPPVAGAPPGGAVPPMAAMGGAGGMGGGSPDENPFTQEVNQKRLQDLLTRLSPASSPESSSPPATEKPGDSKGPG